MLGAYRRRRRGELQELRHAVNHGMAGTKPSKFAKDLETMIPDLERPARQVSHTGPNAEVWERLLDEPPEEMV